MIWLNSRSCCDRGFRALYMHNKETHMTTEHWNKEIVYVPDHSISYISHSDQIFVGHFVRSQESKASSGGQKRHQPARMPSFFESSLALRKLAYLNILKIYPPKHEQFQIKKSGIFHISASNIDCGYSLEPPRRCGSNEYPQSMFFRRWFIQAFSFLSNPVLHSLMRCIYVNLNE